jgi:DNA (cytosine-5)-methyltransferase 3A
MIVVSLFDGISCAKVALEKSNIDVEKYYSSEIDKYAIKISEKNYKDITNLGNVESLKFQSKLDLLIGGSPCQGFSIAGKQLNFQDDRSKLFYEYVRILNETNPKWFILENVRMKKEFADIITKELGVPPVRINSRLVSAQNRERMYWTNIPNVKSPTDKKIVLKDIIENSIDSKYYINAPIKPVSSNGKHIIKVGEVMNGGQGNRVYSINGKSITISASSGGLGAKTGLYLDNNKIRKLTPIECERLQNLPDNYTYGVSDTQRYKSLGNCFTVDVISHILSYIS